MREANTPAHVGLAALRRRFCLICGWQMDSLDREIEDLHSEARVIRQVSHHLRKQLGEWESMLMKVQNKIYELNQLRRPRLDQEYAQLKNKDKRK